MLSSFSGITNPWQLARVYYTEETSSTMEDALRLSRGGDSSGTVVFTSYQKKGRGRFRERKWIAERGKNLLFSIFLETGAIRFPVSMLPVVLGYGVSLAIDESFGTTTLVKWPNDVLAGWKKLAGILCESHGDIVIAGVGINCNQTSFPRELRGSATSILLETGSEADVHTLLGVILARIHSLFVEENPLEGLAERLAYRGERVRIVSVHSRSTPRVAGEVIVLGIGGDGGLLVSDPVTGKTHSIFSGEISGT
jgi:BirA family biotin operon repressor/biotin-[acetyl-CoA-carboxylase] ligase